MGDGQVVCLLVYCWYPVHFSTLLFISKLAWLPNMSNKLFAQQGLLGPTSFLWPLKFCFCQIGHFLGHWRTKGGKWILWGSFLLFCFLFSFLQSPKIPSVVSPSCFLWQHSCFFCLPSIPFLVPDFPIRLPRDYLPNVLLKLNPCFWRNLNLLSSH